MIRLSEDMSPEAQRIHRINKTIDAVKWTLVIGIGIVSIVAGIKIISRLF